MKTIEKFPNYQVTWDGRFWSNTNNGFLQLSTLGGRQIVKLCQDGKVTTFYVHRLVAEAYIPNPLGLKQVRHKDGNKLNNRADNLEWKMSKFRFPARHNEFLSKDDVKDICLKFEGGLRPRDIAIVGSNRYFRLQKIYTRQTWNHVSKDYDWEKWKQRKKEVQ